MRGCDRGCERESVRVERGVESKYAFIFACSQLIWCDFLNM